MGANIKNDSHALNKNVFESKDIVEEYLSQKFLFKPEQVIFYKFSSELQSMRILDIGVGAGRTTHFFSSLAKEYIGIDSSLAMINECKQQFGDRAGNVSFFVCDARALAPFQKNYFDLILFSFNGIDCMNHEDRLKTLREIHRVGKNRAFFIFSTHNLKRIDKLFKLELAINPFRLLKYIRRFFLIHILNKSPKKLKNMNYAVINDGVHDFRLRSYHIKPEEQIRQLEDAGFENIVAYPLNEERAIKDRSEIHSLSDDWFYFLCNIQK